MLKILFLNAGQGMAVSMLVTDVDDMDVGDTDVGDCHHSGLVAFEA